MSAYHTFISTEAGGKRGSANFATLNKKWASLTPVEKARVQSLTEQRRQQILYGCGDGRFIRKEAQRNARRGEVLKDTLAISAEVIDSLRKYGRLPSTSPARDSLMAFVRRPLGLHSVPGS